MIIIGEKINATRKAIAAALEARDEKAIIETAKQQAAAGAHYLDVNGGDPKAGQEEKNMAWLIDIIQANTDMPVAVDSADTGAVKCGLQMAKKRPILNSISLEQHRLAPMLPIVAQFDCMVVALLMSDGGTPCGVDDRLRNAEALINKIVSTGKQVSDIIVDPCFLPVSTDTSSGRTVIDAIAKITAHWPEVHIGGGCSTSALGCPNASW